MRDKPVQNLIYNHVNLKYSKNIWFKYFITIFWNIHALKMLNMSILKTWHEIHVDHCYQKTLNFHNKVQKMTCSNSTSCQIQRKYFFLAKKVQLFNVFYSSCFPFSAGGGLVVQRASDVLLKRKNSQKENK